MSENSKKRIFQQDILKILDLPDEEDKVESENRAIHEKLGSPSPTGSNKSFIPESEVEESESEDDKKPTWKSKVKRKNEQKFDGNIPKKIAKNLDRDYFGHSSEGQPSLESKSVKPSSVFVNQKSSDSEESDQIPDIDPIQEIPSFKFPTPVDTITGQSKSVSKELIETPSAIPVSQNVFDKPNTSQESEDIFVESDGDEVEKVGTPTKSLRKLYTIEFKLKCVKEVTNSSIGAVG